MRDFKGMKRQRGRSRRPGGQGQGQSTNPNRSFDSNGPEGIKVRGNAQTVYERYQQLARDAASSGDRVLAENYLQHAEHYFRLLRIMQPQRPVTEIAAREGFSQGFDIDFEDESGAQAAAQAAAQAQQPSQDGGGEAREGEARDDRGEGEVREGGRRDGRRDRYDRRRGRGEGESREGESGESERRDPPAVIEPQAGEAPAREERLPGFLTRPAPQPAEGAGEAVQPEETAPSARRRPSRRRAAPEAAPAEEDA